MSQKDSLRNQLDAERARSNLLTEHLRRINNDWHPVSTRPCPTCDPISRILGEPFGCTRYRQEYPGAYHTERPVWRDATE